jgi:7-cyano-7-deazaguanine synthase
MKMSTTHTGAELAVLISGGLDSAVLLAEALKDHSAVYPLYVRSGLYWESVELDYLKRFLDAVRCPMLRPLAILEVPLADLYADHWSISGKGVPDAETPDEAVFLPGRNVWLLAKAMVWCYLHHVPTIALGTLAANPFPDATPAFMASLQQVVNTSVGGSVKIVRPYSTLSKSDVVRRGQGLPLELTFSCLLPTDGVHCGRCNKCHDRRQAFIDSSVHDRTPYAGDPKGVKT